MSVSKRLRYEVLRRDNHICEPGEIWRLIPSADGMYEASSLGRVRSLDRIVERTDLRIRTLRGRILKQVVDTQTGYPKVVLYRDARPTHRYVHALVAEAFLGPRPQGMEVAHGDGNRLNNLLQNLRYATRPDNQADKLLHGTSNRGERHPCVVLSERDVFEIVGLLEVGVRQRDIADRFSVCRTTVSAISTGRAWGHLTGRDNKVRG